MRKKVLIILSIVIGAALLCGSFYIKSQVKAGQEKIGHTEESMSMGQKLFSFTPATKDIGDQLTSPIQKKIAEGKEQVEYYTKLANWLAIGGVVFILLGLGIMVSRKK